MAKKSDLQKVGFNQTASASSTGIAPLHGSHAALPITCDASNARIMAVGEYHYTDIWIVAAELLSLLWNTDNSRSFCPSFRSWRISPTAPHISNVSDLPYAASPFYCAAFFVKVQNGCVAALAAERKRGSKDVPPPIAVISLF